jgi:carbamoylphosphate synthase large subunit
MTDARTYPLTVVCLASYFKGTEFIRECKGRGCQVILVTKEKLLGEEWPRESLDNITSVPNEAGPDLFVQIVTQLARRKKIDRLIALEEFDILTTALIREHLRLPGMGLTTARLFRDKLAMRVRAEDAGVSVPDFVHVLNYQEIGEYMERVPPPWVLKPRSDVSAIGITKMHDSEQVWRAIEALDRRASFHEQSTSYLLERFVPGEVFHVDGLVEGGRVVFAGANRYGRPPMDVAHEGGVFISHTLKYSSPDQKELLRLNKKLVQNLRMVRGATHAEFIKSAEDGRFYFLEIAGRIGGAYIADVLEAASGVNIWREWAKIELAGGDGEIKVEPTRKEYAGIALSLSKQEYPDTANFNDPEIAYRIKKRHHVGLIVRSPKLERVTELLDQYARRFVEEFSAVLPPPEKVE